MLGFVLHPTADGRWRWAVHLGGIPGVDNLIAGCIQAGGEGSRDEADMRGQVVLYAAMTLMELLGFSCEVVTVEWDHDPFEGRTLVIGDGAASAQVLG